MKIILDANPGDMGTALQLVFQVMRSNPQQKVGRGSAVRENVGGKVFEVIRNQDSYTVKASGK
jgi:hypothetical protein